MALCKGYESAQRLPRFVQNMFSDRGKQRWDGTGRNGTGRDRFIFLPHSCFPAIAIPSHPYLILSMFVIWYRLESITIIVVFVHVRDAFYQCCEERPGLHKELSHLQEGTGASGAQDLGCDWSAAYKGKVGTRVKTENQAGRQTRRQRQKQIFAHTNRYTLIDVQTDRLNTRINTQTEARS